MKSTTLVLLLVAAAFGAFSTHAMLQVGYLGIWQAGLQDVGAQQVLFDLVIACLLICSWMVSDARRSGRNPWPYVIVTLLGGSVGPLAYLLVGRLFGREPARSLA